MILLTKAALFFYVVAIGGMLCHATKRWLRGEMHGNLITWYCANPRASILALMTAIGGVSAPLLSGTIYDPNLGAHVLAAWGFGYAADSGVNKQ